MIKFLGSFQRVMRWAKKEGFELCFVKGTSFENLFSTVSNIGALINKNESKEKINIVPTNELRKVKNRDEIHLLPMYQLEHKSGEIYRGWLIVGLESNSDERVDPVSVIDLRITSTDY